MKKLHLVGAVALATTVFGCKGEANKVYKQVLEITTDVEALERAANCERIPELKKKLDDAKAEAEKGGAKDDAIELSTKWQKDAIDEAKAACDKDEKPTTTPSEETKMVARSAAMNVLPSALESYRKGQLGDPSACYDSMKKLLASEDEENRKSRCELLKSDPPKGKAAKFLGKLALSREQAEWADQNKESLEKKLKKKAKAKEDDDDDAKKDDPAAKPEEILATEFLSSWKSDNCGDAKKDVPFKIQYSRARMAASVCLPHGGSGSTSGKEK
jgi:hypothetical protein